MKYLVVLGDGMADYPIAEKDNKTPLQMANKPNIDFLAQNGEVGLVQTVPQGVKPGSDVANLSVLGYDVKKCYTGRSPLEAISMGIEMLADDIAVRCNLVTLSNEAKYEDKSMVDYSAGEISTAEATELIKAVNDKLKTKNINFNAGVSYRHCLIKHNTKTGTTLTPPHDISGKAIKEYLPKGLNGAHFLSLMQQSFKILSEHPINKKRVAEGKNPANSIWLWGEGTKPMLQSFESLYGVKGAVISAVDLLKGIGIGAGMKSVDVEGATGTLNTNFEGKAKAVINCFTEGYDFVYLHMEAPDECGHQGDVEGKIKAIEKIDSIVVKYLLDKMKAFGEYKILLLPDHPTPICTKTHASDAVPFVLYDSAKKGEHNKETYSETAAKETGLFYASGAELLTKFLERCEMKEKETSTSTDAKIVEEVATNIAAETQPQEIVEGNKNELNAINATQEDKIDSAEVVKAEEVAENSNEAKAEEVKTEEVKTEEVKAEEVKAEEVANEQPKDNVDLNAIDNAVTSELDKSNGGGSNPPPKKPMSAKTKKAITLGTIAAVLVLAIILSITLPIVILNKGKIFVKEVADFTNTKGDRYVLKNDITLESDLNIANNISLDLNGHNLVINGNLNITTTEGEIFIGTKKKKQWISGGTLTAKDITANIANGKFSIDTIVNAENVTITAKNVAINEAVNFTGNLAINDSEAVALNNKIAVADGKTITFTNSTITLASEIANDITLVNAIFTMNENSKSKNITADALTNISSNGETVGNITGGAVVTLNKFAKCGNIYDTKKVYVRLGFATVGEIVNCANIIYVEQLAIPGDISIYTVGDKVFCSVSAVNNAKRYAFYINENEPIITDTNVLDVTASFISAGKYTVKVKALDVIDGDRFIESDFISLEYNFVITLGDPTNIKVEDKNGVISIMFNTVNFADCYDVSINGVTYKFDKIDDKIQKFDVTQYMSKADNYSISIIAKSNQEGFINSNRILTSYIKKMQMVAPKITVSIADSSAQLKWEAVENAKYYRVATEYNGTIKNIADTDKTNFSLPLKNLVRGTKVMVFAVGYDYYDASSFSNGLIPHPVITLATPEGMAVNIVEGKFMLTFKSVAFAKTYKISCGGVDIVANATEGATQSVDVSKLITTPNAYSFTISASSDEVGVNTSKVATFKYDYIVKLGAPVISAVSDASNYVISWTAVENAEKYEVFINGIKEYEKITTLTFSISKTELEAGKKITVKAVSSNKFYAVSDVSNELIYQIA
ncbi:MAG: cofactor-independent phosphoglycerate mutase [Clostridia bacterium]